MKLYYVTKDVRQKISVGSGMKVDVNPYEVVEIDEEAHTMRILSRTGAPMINVSGTDRFSYKTEEYKRMINKVKEDFKQIDFKPIEI